ncbi:thiamine ABC transporter substrate-binding prote in [Desulfonema ishimotonii]|uniref:Thiamine ABC transporter substrate-binding prote in n=1 Tax=Desulfonema ishimotonii TaxID=45657 RepID=A0A401G142_9BACT|nr:thiamine ABC transporter substrate-binding protein [Desulfonema ishimotonii]GBC62942.1 thiamine ABC transporter substrate-binding prote in [Desulfonema ishimotonii]
MKKTFMLIWAAGMLCLWGGASAVFAGEPVEITVMTHDSFSAGKATVAAFEKANNAKIRFLKAGVAGATLNQAILSKNNPLADVFFGVDNTFLSRALRADIFEPYNSPMLARIDPALRLDPENRLLPVDFGDVCLNYDKKWFAEKGIAPPAGLADLIRPEYRGLTVVENPATSSPGLAFLLATIGHFGEDGYLGFWKKMRANNVLVADGWKKAYWGHFSAASEGDRPVVVSYASSPPAEVWYAEKKPSDAPTAAVTENRSAFRQIEFAGILKGTAHRKLAEKLMDFFLDTPFQEDIPLQMFVFPANTSARLPEVFVKYAKIAEAPATVAPEAIDANREKWIEAWTEAVLR